jgi:hypothetical protein
MKKKLEAKGKKNWKKGKENAALFWPDPAWKAFQTGSRLYNVKLLVS